MAEPGVQDLAVDPGHVAQAVQVSVDPASSEEDRNGAAAFLNSIYEAPDSWRLGLHLFLACEQQQQQQQHQQSSMVPLFDLRTRFMGVSLNRAYLTGAAGAGDGAVENRWMIRDSLLKWVDTLSDADVHPLTPDVQAVLNNVATVVTLCVKHDFPAQWPTAFTDLLGLAAKNDACLLFFLRILDEFTAEVIQFHDGRSQTEKLQNMAIKDHMRDTVIPSIAHFAYSVVSAKWNDQPALAARTLDAFRQFIPWIDINLVVAPDPLQLLYSLLQPERDRELGKVVLQCLDEVIKKGMEARDKLELILHIEIMPVLVAVGESAFNASAASSSLPGGAQQNGVGVGAGANGKWMNGGGFLQNGVGHHHHQENQGDDDDGEDEEENDVDDAFAEQFVAVVNSVCMFLFPYLQDLRHPPPDAAAADEMQAVGGMLEQSPFLAQVMNLLWQSFGAASVDVGTILPAVQGFVTLWARPSGRRGRSGSVSSDGGGGASSGRHGRGRRSNSKGGSPLVTPAFGPGLEVHRLLLPEQHARVLCMTLYQRLRYPADFTFDPEDEDEALVEAQRQSMRKLYARAAKIAPDLAVEFVQEVFRHLPMPLSTCSFVDLEAALQLVLAFAESQQKDHIQQGAFPELVVALHGTDVAQHNHPSVLLCYYDICVRYADILATQPPLLEGVLSAFFGDHGVRCAHVEVQSRACYLALRLALALRDSAMPLYTGHVLELLRDVLLTESPATPEENGFREQNIQDLFELAGALLANEHLPPELQATRADTVGSIVRAQLNCIAGLLESCDASLMSSSPAALAVAPAHEEHVARQTAIVNAVATKICYIARLSQRFSYQEAPDVIPVFGEAVQASLHCLRTLAWHDLLRHRVEFVVHRAFECVGPALLELLQVDDLLALVQFAAEQNDAEQATRVITELAQHYRRQSVPILAPLVLPFTDMISRIATQISSTTADGSGTAGGSDVREEGTHVLLERARVHKCLLSFIMHLVHNNCGSALAAPEYGNRERFTALLEGIVDLIHSSDVPGLRKGAVACCTRMAEFNFDTSSSSGGGSSSSGGGAGASEQAAPASVAASSGSAADDDVPEEVAQAEMWFKETTTQFLLHSAVPACLRAAVTGVIDPGLGENTAVFHEIANLLWALRPIGVADYLSQHVAPTLSWPDAATDTLLEAMGGADTQQMWRIRFKRFAVSAVRGGGR